MIQPGVENGRLIPHMGCPVARNGHESGHSGEHREHNAILPRQLTTGDQHQNDEDEVKVTDLQHLGCQRNGSQVAFEGHTHTVAVEDAAGTEKGGKQEHNVLSEPGHLGHSIRAEHQEGDGKGKEDDMRRTQKSHDNYPLD